MFKNEISASTRDPIMERENRISAAKIKEEGENKQPKKNPILEREGRGERERGKSVRT